MMNFIKKFIDKRFGVFLLFLTLGALVYLPKLNSFGFYKDDWYLMYDALVKGPSFFRTVFAIDRPARAPLQAAVYLLFGQSLLLYHISALLFRVMGAFAFNLTLNKIFPQRSKMNIVGGMLFLVYPGYLTQPNAVDFQAHTISLALAMVSIYLTMLATEAKEPLRKWSLLVISVLLTWAYLGLMEYFIGIEVFRFVLLIVHEKVGWQEALVVLRKKAIQFGTLSLGAVGFLVWRVLLFDGGRKATDITSQLAGFASQPFLVGTRWLIQLMFDIANVLAGAWAVPVYMLYIPLRLRDQLFISVIAIGVSAIAFFIVNHTQEEGSAKPSKIGFSALLVLFSLAGALFPVILANRHVDFGDYSRYTLPALAPAILLLTLFLGNISNKKLRMGTIVVLMFISASTQVANAVNYAEEATATKNFWWQVYWRLPQIKPGTTIVATYPNIAIQEDYFVWGPANLIYAAQAQDGETIDVPIEALVLNQETVLQIISGKGEVAQSRRGNQTNADLSKILVIDRSQPNACVRVLDGKLPELSDADKLEIRAIANKSILEQIDLGNQSAPPPKAFFGTEPDHGWCYAYQKADLARQMGDWRSVITIFEKALKDGEYPADPIEWMPLLQAYAITGDTTSLKPYVSIMAQSENIRTQACNGLLLASNDLLTKEYVLQKFCE